MGNQIPDSDFEGQNKKDWAEVIGDWYFDEKSAPTENNNSFIDKFMLALASGNLLVSRKSEQNDNTALELLKEVHTEDPLNSAPLLFAATIESRRGHFHEANELLLLAQKTQRFDSYVTTISRRIFSSVRSGSDLLQAYSIWSQVPIPNYTELRKFLNQKDSALFAWQMMASGLDDSTILPDVDWFVLDYATGENMLRKSSIKTNLPKYQDIIIRKEHVNPLGANRILQKIKHNCDISTLDELAFVLKNMLKKQL